MKIFKMDFQANEHKNTPSKFIVRFAEHVKNIAVLKIL